VSLFGVLLAGLFIDQFPGQSKLLGFAILFACGAFFGATDIIVHAFIPEPHFKKHSELRAVLPTVLAPLKNPDFLRFTIAIGLWNFTAAFMAPYVPKFLLEPALGLNYLHSALFFNAIPIAAVIISARPWGYLCDKFGSKPILVIAAASTVAVPIFYCLVTPQNCKLALPFIFAWAGVMSAGYALSFGNLLLGLSPREERVMYVAVLLAAMGLLAFTGPLLGGVIMNTLQDSGVRIGTVNLTNYQVVFLTTSCLYVICLLFMSRVREVKEKPFGLVIQRIFSTNLVRSLMNIAVITDTSPPKKKARALRRLGRMRSKLAVEEIIEHLDDPDPKVRAEAAAALGRIGDREALQPLLDKLSESDPIVKVQMARALGSIKAAESVGPLIDVLADENPFVRAAAAEALGEIGDDSASLPLVETVCYEANSTVYTECLGALAKLGDISALWTALPRLRKTRSVPLRRQLAVTIADLVGRKGEFYEILAREKKVHGAAVMAMAARILRNARPLSGADRYQLHAVRERVDRLTDAYQRTDYASCIEELTELARWVRERNRSAAAQARESVSSMALRYLESLSVHEEQEALSVTVEEDLFGTYLLALVGRNKARA